VEYLLHASSVRKRVNVDVERETGCGIVPYEDKEKATVATLR
jgi:formylmethanofuran dehydrogenase subunit A